MFGFGKKVTENVPDEKPKEKRYVVRATILLNKDKTKTDYISDKEWEKEEDAVTELEEFLKKVEYTLNATDNYVTIMEVVFDKKDLVYVNAGIEEIEI